MIVCFGSDVMNIHTVAGLMSKKGWSLNSLQSPASVHICCTVKTGGIEETFLSDLSECAAEVARMTESGECSLQGQAAIYGVASSLPPGPVDDLLREYNNCVLKM